MTRTVPYSRVIYTSLIDVPWESEKEEEIETEGQEQDLEKRQRGKWQRIAEHKKIGVGDTKRQRVIKTKGETRNREKQRQRHIERNRDRDQRHGQQKKTEKETMRKK